MNEAGAGAATLHLLCTANMMTMQAVASWHVVHNLKEEMGYHKQKKERLGRVLIERKEDHGGRIRLEISEDKTFQIHICLSRS